MAPHGCYPTRESDRWIVIAIDGDAEWKRLIEMMGNRAWVSDSRFEEAEARLRNTKDLDELIGAGPANTIAMSLRIDCSAPVSRLHRFSIRPIC